MFNIQIKFVYFKEADFTGVADGVRLKKTFEINLV